VLHRRRVAQLRYSGAAEIARLYCSDCQRSRTIEIDNASYLIGYGIEKVRSTRKHGADKFPIPDSFVVIRVTAKPTRSSLSSPDKQKSLHQG
jgi:hypothetical protein